MSKTLTFPMTPEQWAASDLSYYTLCKIQDVCGLTIYGYRKSYQKVTGTLEVDALGNFLTADLRYTA